MNQVRTQEATIAIAIIGFDYRYPKGGAILIQDIENLISKDLSNLYVGSCGDESEVDISLKDAKVKYNYWDNDLEAFISGSAVIPTPLALKALVCFVPRQYAKLANKLIDQIPFTHPICDAGDYVDTARNWIKDRDEST